MKYFIHLVCCIYISSGDGLHLVLLGAVVSLMFLETALLKIAEVQTEYLYYFSRNIQSIGLSLICVLSEIDDTRRRYFKLYRQ